MKQAGRKTGQLSTGSKVPDREYNQGLDWGRIARERAERMAREWDEGVRNVDTIRARWLSTLTPKELAEEENKVASGKPTSIELDETGEPVAIGYVPPKKKASTPIQTGFRGRHRTYDVDEIVRLYVDEGLMPKQIATKPNMPSERTVLDRLKDRGVFDPKKFRQGWIGSPDGKPPADMPIRRDRPRRKFCGVCGADLDKDGNSSPKWKKGHNGIMRPAGRECIPCRTRRSQEARDGK